MALATLLKHKSKEPRRRKSDQTSQIPAGLLRAGSLTPKPKQARSRLDPRKRTQQVRTHSSNHV